MCQCGKKCFLCIINREIRLKLLIIGVILVIGQVEMVQSRIVHKITDFNKPVNEAIQRCRVNCLNLFLHDETNQITTDECSSRPNCFMCWDYCRMLHNEKKIVVTMMCSDTICFSGCKQACKFYKLPFFDKTTRIRSAPITDNNQNVENNQSQPV